jgi:RNA polymerase subunit RPABC4/transcription elongation factor Spt4
METTCNRCHQPVEAENCYCPACGLPQLVYATEGPAGQVQPERWDEAVRDAATIDWKPALRLALLMAVPAGVMCSLFSPVGIAGWFLMAAAAAWSVSLYMRSQRPAWITIGAGARIGLVTGLLGGWSAAATTGATLFAMRYFFHNGSFFDDFWVDFVNNKFVQQYAQMGIDAQTIGAYQKRMLSPEGRAGFMLSAILFLVTGLIVSAIAGGALGARLMGRRRQPEL